MKRFWTALAVALAAIFAAAGCNDYGNTFQVPTGASITSLSPSNASAGSPQFTLTVNGSGYVTQTVVQWNGKTIPTTVQTDSAGNVLGISATVSAALVVKPGTSFVNTLSPHSGAGMNGLSNPLPFIINPPGNPVPTVTSMSPTCAAAGSAALTLSVMGTNFLPASDPSGGSQVQWTSATTAMQSTLPIVGTTSSSQIQATVSSPLLASADTARVTVFNPPAPQAGSGSGGGGISPAGQLFTVQATAGPCPPPTSAISSNASAMEETPAVSADGRYVSYAAMQNDHAQVFVRDTCEGAAAECQQRTTLLSVTTEGDAANDDSRSPSISADGRYVAFSSAATNLLPDAAAGRQVYLRDICVGAPSSCAPSTQLISTDSSGALVGTESILPSVSASGRFVAFVAVTPSHAKSSAHARATAGSPNSGFRQVFVRDTCLGAANCTAKTTRISLQPGDAPASGAKPAGAALSGHAKHVAVPGATTATLFTRGVVVDDQVFLALTSQQ
jgi:trimeric autotransporter adhesin